MLEIILWSYLAIAFAFGVWLMLTVPIPDEASFHGVPYAATGWFAYIALLAAFWPITGACYVALAIERQNQADGSDDRN